MTKETRRESPSNPGVITVARSTRDKLAGAMGIPAIGVLLTALAVVDSQAGQRAAIAIVVFIIDAGLAYGFCRLIMGWSNHLSFEEGGDQLIIRNYSSHEERIPLTDIVSIDVRGRQQVIHYRSRGGKTRKYGFVPYATPEVRAWHRFIKSNEDHLRALTTQGSRRLHREMDGQEVRGETGD
jgi:hypothetical protein